MIDENIAQQLSMYGSNGDQVIQVCATAAEGKTREQILAEATTLKQSMEDIINELGPSNVSKHCADPSVLSVIDVAASSFNSGNINLFTSDIAGRVDRLIDERNTNSCFHLEKAVV